MYSETSSADCKKQKCEKHLSTHLVIDSDLVQVCNEAKQLGPAVLLGV